MKRDSYFSINKIMDTQQIVLAPRPEGLATPANFRTEDIAVPGLQENEVLVEGIYYSVDPYMRGRMNDAKSYISTFQVDQPISGGVVGKVIRSMDPSLKEGDLVLSRLPWRRLNVVHVRELQKINASIAPASYFLGILGMPGLTAYFGITDICKPKTGETGVISGAAGAVGIVAGQIAKIMGCRVVGIAGSAQKVEMLKTEFEFDEVINYKTSTDINADLAKACPYGVNFYFDNVGGEISDAVMSLLNYQARIAVCGQISLYNDMGVSTGPRLQPLLLSKSALMQGFMVGNYQDRFGEGFQRLSKWLKEGNLKYQETIIKGFDQLPNAFIGLFNGDNIGKMIVEA